MRKGHVFAYYGNGKGKTALAVGVGMRAIGEELNVIMVQFLDNCHAKELIPLKRLEPDFRVFCFEKRREIMTEQAYKELTGEVRNAFNFAKKILETGECDVLILDGIFDTIDKGFVQVEELCAILAKRPSYMDVILTGANLPEGILLQAEAVVHIQTEKLLPVS